MKTKLAPARDRKYDGPIRVTVVIPRYGMPSAASDSKIMRVAQPQDKLPGGLCERNNKRGRK
jgi:hypothetical protein